MRKSDLVFFATGLAALVYETVWARLLARLLGSDAGGAAVVLASFMGGMALGAAAGQVWARRSARPVRLFVGIEVGLAGWAALSPVLLTWLDPVDGMAARAFVAAAVLLGPTILMGATFPLMGRITIARDEDTGRETSAFYGANTLGAAAGALLAPVALMPLFGLRGALWAAAVLDLVAAGLALAWLAAARSEPPATRSSRSRRFELAREPLVWSAFAMGFSALALEVLLTRLLVSVTGASIYAFSIVLAVFLTGIGLGSRWLGASSTGVRSFSFAALVVAPVALGGLFVLRWQLGEADLFAGLSNRMTADAGALRWWLWHVLLSALALLPPALAFGWALPSAVAGVVARHPGVARERCLAAVYGLNTSGALFGALAAGFLLLPSFGLRAAIGVALVPTLLAALLAGGSGSARWILALTASGTLGGSVLWPRDAGESALRVLSLVHGPHATVTVEETAEAPAVRSLRVNGKVVATTAPVDLRLQRLLGHVPGLLHGDVRRALVIGLGTGMTAGSLLDLPTLEELSVVEISPAMITGGAGWFARWNGDLLADERATLVVADGRHALARSPKRFDLITSDPIHPWTRGSSDLYALEHFERIAEHLAEGGIASQWLPLYQLSTTDVRTVIATWCAAFPHTSAWLTAYDLVLVGSRSAPPREGALHETAFPPRVAAALAEAGIHGPVELAALEVSGDEGLRAFAAGVAPMMDDLPVLEFRAPRSYLAGYSREALAWAGRTEYLEQLAEPCRARGAEVRAALARFLGRLPEGLSRAAQLYGEELLALPPVR